MVAAQNRRPEFSATYRAATKGSGNLQAASKTAHFGADAAS